MNKLPCKPGIYQIRNLNSNKVYVGGTVNMRYRQSSHICELKRDRHGNGYLQNEVNKYGLDKFEFEVLEEVEDKDRLVEREQFYIDKLLSYERDKGYNLTIASDSTRGRICPQETRDKISKSRMGKCVGELNPNYGKKFTDETKIKLSMSHKGKTAGDKNYFYRRTLPRETIENTSKRNAKLSKEKVIEIYKLIQDGGMSQRSIADLYNVTETIISSIKTGKTKIYSKYLREVS